MKYDRLYNFISPKTGKIILPTDYTLLGDNRGFSYASPILQHIKLDQIKLQKYLDDNTIFIDNTFDIEKRIKLKNLPLLGAAKFPLPDPSFFDSLYGTPLIPDVLVDALKEIINLASSIPIPNPTYDAFNYTDWIMNAPFMPQIIAGNPKVRLDGGIDPETIISSSVAFLQIAVARTKKQFQYGGFIVKKRNIKWDWDNSEKLNQALGVFDILADKFPSFTEAKNLFLSLYNLNSDYTFGNSVQALEELLTEHEQTNPYTGEIVKYKKGGVLALNNTADIKLAIPGSDFVDYKTNSFGPFALVDALATENSNKFISKSTRTQIKPNNPTLTVTERIQKRDEIAITEDKYEVIEGDKFQVQKELSLEYLLDNSFDSMLDGDIGVLGYNKKALLVPYKDSDNNKILLSDLFKNISQITTLLKVVIGVSDSVKFLDITTEQAKKLNKIIKAIGGIKDATNMVDVNIDDAKKLVKTVSNAVGSAAKDAIEDTLAEAASKAADVFTNKAALLEIEAQIAALAGVTEINTLWNLFNTILATGTAVGGYHYGQYIRGQSLNVKNTWESTDKNDEATNATGTIRPLSITPYSYEDRGHGTLWFDSNGRKSKTAWFNDTPPKEWYSEGGLRIFSWDSSITDTFDSDLAPVHMGLFGYRKFPTTPDEYKGFIFRIELDHDKKSILPTGTDINNDNYRFPIKFGLYDVHRTVSSLSQTKHGWDSKNTIFEYDYINFNFYKPVQTKSIKVTDNLVIPVKQSSDISLDSEIGSMFFCPDL